MWMKALPSTRHTPQASRGQPLSSIPESSIIPVLAPSGTSPALRALGYGTQGTAALQAQLPPSYLVQVPEQPVAGYVDLEFALCDLWMSRGVQ